MCVIRSQDYPNFDENTKRDLIKRFNSIEGVKILTSSENNSRRVDISACENVNLLNSLLNIFEWIINEHKNLSNNNVICRYTY